MAVFFLKRTTSILWAPNRSSDFVFDENCSVGRNSFYKFYVLSFSLALTSPKMEYQLIVERTFPL